MVTQASSPAREEVIDLDNGNLQLTEALADNNFENKKEEAVMKTFGDNSDDEGGEEKGEDKNKQEVEDEILTESLEEVGNLNEILT